MISCNSNTEYVVGIDEAGRGPLVGDMFVVGVVCRGDKLGKLQALGVRDSKMLTRAMREKLFQLIVGIIDEYYVVRVPPEKIDAENLNNLYLKALSEIVKYFIERYNVSEIYVDATGRIEKIKRLISNLGFNGKVVVEYKADRIYTIVSTASIVAKVLRDRHIDELSKVYGPIGSGYPSDPKTIKWIREYYMRHGEIPPIVRRKWRTLDRILKV